MQAVRRLSVVLNGWCANPAPLKTTGIKRICFQPAGSGKRIAGDLVGRIPVLHRPAQGRGRGSTIVARGDGKELVFSTPSGADFIAAEVKPGTTFEVGLPKQIFRAARHAHIIAGHDYAMTNDGKRFLLRETPNNGQEIEPLYLILNWPSLLDK